MGRICPTSSNCGREFVSYFAFLFKDKFRIKSKLLWIVQLELALYALSIGVVVYGVRAGFLPSVIPGIVGWLYLGIVLGTIILGFRSSRSGS